MGLLAGKDAFVTALASLFREAADALIEQLYFVAAEPYGSLAVAHTIGTLAMGGGEFESVYVQLIRCEGDRVIGAELFDVDQLEAARARFEELRPKAALVPANAASRVRDRADSVFATEDWRDRFRALVSDDFVFDDRSKKALVTGGLELAVGSYEQMRAMGVRIACELIGTVGDHIAIQRVVFGGGPPGGEFEVERLRLTEVDTAGRIKASV
jgi:hypothetical protein